jgi:beta-glucosidase
MIAVVAAQGAGPSAAPGRTGIAFHRKEVRAMLRELVATHSPADAGAACAKLNLSMKVDLMHGRGWPPESGAPSEKKNEIDGYGRNTGCGQLCGRQTFRWDNGPQGFGDNAPPGTSTQWPSQLNLAASFDPALAYDFGVAIGVEWWNKGTNILEGPGINLMRIPYNGRTFEYMVGEDPVLGSILVGPTIDGMQENAMAVAKHFILNNQELDRQGVNEIVDEKTLIELYAPPFETAAKHEVAGYMCAYNRINGVWACQQPATLQRLLRDEYDYKGFVVSDWDATHSVTHSLNAGMDIEMPESNFFNEQNLSRALDEGRISMAQIDSACEHILTPFFRLPADRRFPCERDGSCIEHNVSTASHKALARRMAASSIVLLKNEGGLLPLPLSPTGEDDASADDSQSWLGSADESDSWLDSLKRWRRELGGRPLTVALIGPDAAAPYTYGQGSGGVRDSNVAVSPLSAFSARLGPDRVIHASGCSKDGQPDPKSAVSAAASADVAIVLASAHSGEGNDRESLDLHPLRCDGASEWQQEWQRRQTRTEEAKAAGELREADHKPTESFRPTDEEKAASEYAMAKLITAVAAKQPNTIVAMTVPGPVLTDWRGDVRAILCAFLPGEQYGNALADLVFNATMPQARLPVSMPLTPNDQNMTRHQYPGYKSKEFKGHREVVYSEGQIVGYRWYDRHGVVPAYPFGFGLTYGSFTYSHLHVSGRTVSFTVTRDARGGGCDTPQLYVSFPTAATDPAVPDKVLRYFEKTCEAHTTVTYTLTQRDLSTWDVRRGAWVIVSGTFGVHVMSAAQGGGELPVSSSLHGSLTVDKDEEETRQDVEQKIKDVARASATKGQETVAPSPTPLASSLKDGLEDDLLYPDSKGQAAQRRRAEHQRELQARIEQRTAKWDAVKARRAHERELATKKRVAEERARARQRRNEAKAAAQGEVAPR